jgi:Ca2+-binding RTX toxin-like protein
VTWFFGSAAVSADLTAGHATGYGADTLVGVENLEGGLGSDTLIGDDLGNALNGDGGDDHLEGRGGDDVLDGSVGTDFLDGGAGTHDRCSNGETVLNCEL